MKNAFFSHRILLSLLCLVTLGGHLMADSKKVTRLNARISHLADYLDILQADPKKAIPAEIFAKAEGVVIMREYKVGFVFGAKGGGGVALVKDKKTGQWSPPAFLGSGEGSFGFQIGGQRSDSVFLLMDAEGMKLLKDGNLKLGVDIRATAGPHSAGDEAKFKTGETPILVYSDVQGLFGGAAIEGGAVVPQDENNQDLYGAKMEEILFAGKAKITDAGKKLVGKIQKFSTVAEKKEEEKK